MHRPPCLASKPASDTLCSTAPLPLSYIASHQPVEILIAQQLLAAHWVVSPRIHAGADVAGKAQ